MGLSTVIAMGVFLFWFLVVLHGLCFRKNCPTYLTWPAPAASTFSPSPPPLGRAGQVALQPQQVHLQVTLQSTSARSGK